MFDENFLECGSFILLVVKWHLSGGTKLYINFNLQKIIDQLLLLGTIFINKLLIESVFSKMKKKQKKSKKRNKIKKKFKVLKKKKIKKGLRNLKKKILKKEK